MRYFGRGIQFAFENFKRNLLVSLATTGIMVITLFIVSSLGLLNFLSDFTIKDLEKKVDITVYFEDEATSAQMKNVQKYVESFSEVDSTIFISKDEGLEEFRKDNAGRKEILEAIDELGENPLENSMVVKAKNPNTYEGINQKLNPEDFKGVISEVDYTDNKSIIERLTRITRTSRQIALVVSGVFAIVSILVIFNTVRLAIYSHREEIGIMRLVGASNWFIRWPFIFEGILYGFFASIITTGILYPILHFATPKIANFFGSGNLDLMSYYISNLHWIFLFLLGCGVVFGVISSSIAIGRYLSK